MIGPRILHGLCAMTVPRRKQHQAVRILRQPPCIQSRTASQLHSTHSPSTTLIMMEFAAPLELVHMQLSSMEPPTPTLLVDPLGQAKPKQLELVPYQHHLQLKLQLWLPPRQTFRLRRPLQCPQPSRLCLLLQRQPRSQQRPRQTFRLSPTAAATQMPTTTKPSSKPTTRNPTSKPTTNNPTTRKPKRKPTTRKPTTRNPV